MKDSAAKQTEEPSVASLRQEKGRKRGQPTSSSDGEVTAAKAPRLAFKMDDRVALVSNIKGQLPKRDTHSYKSTIGKVNWEKVAFSPFTPDDCLKEWELIQADIKKYKNATEIADEALKMVNTPSYLPKLSSLYPNMPKKPLTPFFQYYSEKNKSVKEKNPSFSQTKISQVLSEKYKTLPEKKKMKYVTKYAADMKAYEEKKTAFFLEHPELKQSKKGEGSRAPICPTPYRMWLAKQLIDRPNVRRSEVEAELRVKWKSLSDKRRLKWIHMSIQDKDAYERAIQDYCKAHQNFKPNTKALLTKFEKALYDKQQGKPTRPPMNGYSLFCSHFMKLKNELTSTQRMQACSKEWKKLSDQDRTEYNQRTVQAKKDYFDSLEKYVLTLPQEEAAKYESELAASKIIPKSRRKVMLAEKKSTFSGLEIYLAQFKDKFEKKNPELKPKAIEKMLKDKYQTLPKSKKDKYEDKAKEMNALSSGSDSDSSSDDDNDDSDEEEDEEEEDDIMARNLWIKHNLHSYMQVHKLKEARAKKSLKLAWENLEKARKVPWKKQAQQVINRMQQLLADMPKKPHTSAYGIFTSEMMRNPDIVKLDQKRKMKAVAEKWKSTTKIEKRKYETKKDRLWKKHEKDVEKYKKSLSSTDQELFEKVLANPIPRTKKKVTKTANEQNEHESSEESDSDESEEEDDDDGSSGDEDSDDEDGGQEEEKGTEESAEEEAAVEEKPVKMEQSSDDSSSSSESSSDSDSDEDD